MQDAKGTRALPLLDLHPRPADFLSDAKRGLTASPKRLSPMYFYDARGSKLFDQICDLPEYYPTRTEISILRRYQQEIGMALGHHVCLAELGSGSSTKTSIVLDAAKQLHSYVPIDISRQHLEQAAQRIATRFPVLRVMPVCADFLGDLRLPDASETARRKVFWFPGSTVGNLGAEAREQLLERIRLLCQPQGGGLLIGIDLQKDETVIERAYNDERGVTAAFNLNLLRRMNRELGTDFDTDAFAHRAFYNAEEGRLEMHLEALDDQHVTLQNESIEFQAGETVCTEYSYKFTVEGFTSEAARLGYSLLNVWTDPKRLFAVLMLRC